MTRPAVLSLLAHPVLRDEAERVTAAADVAVVHGPPDAHITRKTWTSAGAVFLDLDSARRCAAEMLPRRPSVFVLDADATPDHAGQRPAEPAAALLATALSVGAQQVFRLPEQAGELVAALALIVDTTRAEHGGAVVAVLGGRGGAGASVFASALALQADPGALLVDLDPWAGGIDLLLGINTKPGVRWPDIAVRDGRLEWAAVRDALPNVRGVSVMSGTRLGFGPAPEAVEAVIDAGRRGGVTVVCDLTRQLTDVTQVAIDAADLLVLLTACDVRSCAAAAAIAPVLMAINPNVGVVVRGPAPGGLRPNEVAEIIGLPLLAAMRPEPLLAQKLERAGLSIRRRSPLAGAASEVLSLLTSSSAVPGARAA